ncbi:hypothetical protein [Roseovarius sp. D22-M7]|uniref:hypothetical protein n=1 Tax=Roseovarius sp. D22-M7 TaxID=3127116 RepID=UPI0030104858
MSPPDSWLGRMLARKPRMRVAIGPGHAMTRQIRALLTRKADYWEPMPVGDI